MVTDWRSLAVIENGCVHLDEKLLDPFAVSTTDYSGFNPGRQIPPYEYILKAVIDLETTGLNPDKDRIIMIGVDLYGRNGQIEALKVIRADHYPAYDERSMLIELGRFLKAYDAEYLIFYNGHKFDIPFLKKRMELNKIDSQITFDFDFETTLRNTTALGKPIQFYQPNHPKYKFIDTMNLVYQDDFVTRKLVSHSLKQVPVQWKMREASDRLELTYQEILDCWANVANGGLDKLETYLIDDLKDTRMLTDRLLPNYYYQFEVLPVWYDIQKITNWGNATKWNHLLNDACGYKPEPDHKLAYKGGYTEGYAGFFLNPCKIDVASMYPFIMLAYDIHSHKDPKRQVLKYLYYFRSQRLINKALGKDKYDDAGNLIRKGDPIAKGKEGYQKIFINSGYGQFGVTNKGFNDMVAAAAVTAYGRALIDLMKKAIIANGGNIIEVDTDGIIYNSSSPEENKRIHLEVLKALPNGLNTPEMIEFEFNEKAVWIPPGEDRGIDGDGQRKNYLIFHHNGKITKKGRFNSRDGSWMLKTFQVEYLRIYLENGLEAALKYYKSIKRQIILGQFPVEKLAITRLVRKNEKTMPLLGFPTGERHTFWYYKKGKKPKGKPIYEATKTLEYSNEYYVEQLQELFDELPDNVKN